MDIFLGDDFTTNGAFRLSYGFEYVAMMETGKENFSFQLDCRDTFEWYLKLGALSNVNAKYFPRQAADLEQLRRPPELRRPLEEGVARTRLTRVTCPDPERRRLV